MFRVVKRRVDAAVKTVTKPIRISGLRCAVKPLVILLLVSAAYFFITRRRTDQVFTPEYIQTTRFHSTSRPSTHDPLNSSTQSTEEHIITLYKQKIKEIQQIHIPEATVTKACNEEASPDKPCQDTKCHSKFLSPPEENLRDLLQHQYKISDHYLRVIASMVNRKLDGARVAFLTAVSANHYDEWQGLIKNLNDNVFPSLQSYKFFVYDLGMDPEQVQVLNRHCRECHVRKFPFAQLPPVFSNLKSYTWKPILVQAHLAVSEVVLWMDSSVRFITTNLTSVFETVRERGMLISPTFVSAPLRTNSKMYNYFGVKPCQMSPYYELEGTFLFFHNDTFIQNAVVKSWLSCAFASNCMFPFQEVPDELRHMIYSCKSPVRKYGRCHRFDQSALTTILTKVFMDQVSYIFLKRNTVNVNMRGDKIKYFPEVS